MATWTAVKTWTTGELVSAALLNTHHRDNFQYLYDRANGTQAKAGMIRIHQADSLGGIDNHRLVFGGTTYSNWHLCNGDANIDGSGVNAPDLRNKFVIIAGDTYAQGATGGAATVNLAHTHAPGTLANDAIALVNHVHGTSYTTAGPSATVNRDGTSVTGDYAQPTHTHAVSGNTGNPTSNPTHAHTLSGATASGGSAAQDILPLYRGTYYFVYIGS